MQTHNFGNNPRGEGNNNLRKLVFTEINTSNTHVASLQYGRKLEASGNIETLHSNILAICQCLRIPNEVNKHISIR